MYIPNQDSSDSELNSESIMEQSMSILFDMVINPMQENLDTDDLQTLGLIGVAFKIMAEKAHAYEKLMGQASSEESEDDFSRN